MNRITSARPRPGHKIWLEYSDGEAGEVDFDPVIAHGGIFAKLAEQNIFEQVHVGEHGRYLEFPGDLDFCADALREKLIQHAHHDAGR